MSYNTRRSTTGPGFGTPQQPAASNVGQRRPVVSNNFVAGGQLTGSQMQKPQVSQQTPQRAAQQTQPSGNFRNQTQSGQVQQSYSSNYSSTPQQQVRYPPAQQSTPVKTETKPIVQQQPIKTQAPILPGSNPPAPEVDDMDTSGEGKKKFWNKGKGVKISRAEKVRRRNLKLSKILQPKNAVMILNELVKGCTYGVEELPVKIDVNQFRGTVVFEGQEFAGTGRTKIGAKNAAAETALKHLVKNKKLTTMKKEEDGDEKMDITEEEGSSQVMPWSHIASFAMFKLFSTWGEDTDLVNKVTPQEIMAGASNGNKPSHEPKPAKKMPENPESMNPLMLMHQMLPNAVWEEVSKTGTPPNVVFTMNVVIDNKQYSGSGNSKKAAKKVAAYAACHEALNIAYPPDIWTPSY